jgi:hypothetical protein
MRICFIKVFRNYRLGIFIINDKVEFNFILKKILVTVKIIFCKNVH